MGAGQKTQRGKMGWCREESSRQGPGLTSGAWQALGTEEGREVGDGAGRQGGSRPCGQRFLFFLAFTTF